MMPHRVGIPEDEPWLDKHSEWIDGQAIEKPNGALASWVNCRLLGRLHQHVCAHELGTVFSSTCGYQAFADQPSKVRRVGGSFIACSRLANDEAPEGNVRIAPDLACELIGPDDGATALERRVADFLAAGTQLFWIVYLNFRTVF
jgi:hypothetical protein